MKPQHREALWSTPNGVFQLLCSTPICKLHPQLCIPKYFQLYNLSNRSFGMVLHICAWWATSPAPVVTATCSQCLALNLMRCFYIYIYQYIWCFSPPRWFCQSLLFKKRGLTKFSYRYTHSSNSSYTHTGHRGYTAAILPAYNTVQGGIWYQTEATEDIWGNWMPLPRWTMAKPQKSTNSFAQKSMMKYYLTSGQTLRFTSHSKAISAGMHCTIHSAVSHVLHCRDRYPSLSTSIWMWKSSLGGLWSTAQVQLLSCCQAFTWPVPKLSKKKFHILLLNSSHPAHSSPHQLLGQPCVQWAPHSLPSAYSGNSCRIVWTVSQEALLLLSTSLRTPAKEPAHLLSRTDKLRGLELKFRNSKWGTLDTILLT